MAAIGCRGSEAERRLCHLLTRYLCPDHQSENDLLISLSSVSREIRRWTSEIGSSDSEQIEEATSGSHHTQFRCVSQSIDEDHIHNCLTRITSSLVTFLSMKSPFIQHLAGNTIAFTSTFLATSSIVWEEFVRLLWTSLEASLSSLVSQTSLKLNYMPLNKRESKTMQDNSVTLVRSSLLHSSCHEVINLIHVLHVILKHIKLLYDDLMEVYIHLAISSISKFPWDSLSDFQMAQIANLEKRSNNDHFVVGDIRISGSVYVFPGALLQLLCSLVNIEDLEEAGDLNDFDTYSKLTTLVPKLLSFCLYNDPDNQKYDCMHICRYLRHKALMLMIRISFWNHWKCDGIVIWLKLLREHFEDLLYLPISNCHVKQHDSLEGSPFQEIITSDGSASMVCTCHLQRQANFLFIKCCFKLIHLNYKATKECGYVTGISSVTPDAQIYLKGCCDMGLSELSGWLKRHVSLDKSLTYLEDGTYSRSCNRFALTFLQLYMDEDDMLFDILLQLLDIPNLTLQEHISGDCVSEGMKNDTMLHVSRMFNPIHFFHVFLSLLHYDHSVLLDYLISKDIGILCLEYLLRCLRIVCRFWSIFLKFSVCENEIIQKKVKASVARNDFSAKIKCSLEKSFAHNRLIESGGRQRISRKLTARQQAFEDVKCCLLSLRTSVEDLHRKNLFPYNPTALLRSFTRFEELCLQQENIAGHGGT